MSPIAKMPGLAGLEGRGVDLDQVAVEVEPPLGDRAQLHLQAVEGEQRVAGERAPSLPSAALDADAPRAGRPRPRGR